jgi:glycosyltransferase involved in cell wall biosynthesis
MIKKLLFITEALFLPFDEGLKNIAFSLYSYLDKRGETLTVTKEGNDTGGLKVKKVNMNKFFLGHDLKKLIQGFAPDVIIYLPDASITFNSFIRAKVLKNMSGQSKVVVLGVKQRGYSWIQKVLIKNLFIPDLVLLLSKFDSPFFRKGSFRADVLPPAVDNIRFRQANEQEKKELRNKYNIPIDFSVVLHVGHIRATRNTESLIEVQNIENTQVVIVDSTSTPTDRYLKEKLQRKGIRIIDEYLPDISQIYRMSDIYVFPVLNRIAAVDMPLSVLEAMSCNLPVIATRFGGLPVNFGEDAGFRYFSTIEELVELVKAFKSRDNAEIHNTVKVKDFTWDKFADKILRACDELV